MRAARNATVAITGRSAAMHGALTDLEGRELIWTSVVGVTIGREDDLTETGALQGWIVSVW